MAKPELGVKRQCQNCGAKFFDLNREPIVCPKCGTVFQGAPIARAQRAEAKEEETDEAPAPADAELVSLEDAESSEEKVTAAADDDVEVEDDDDSAEDTFLEEEEEEDDDVSGLIDGDIANDEEP